MTLGERREQGVLGQRQVAIAVRDWHTTRPPYGLRERIERAQELP